MSQQNERENDFCKFVPFYCSLQVLILCDQGLYTGNGVADKWLGNRAGQGPSHWWYFPKFYGNFILFLFRFCLNYCCEMFRVIEAAYFIYEQSL